MLGVTAADREAAKMLRRALAEVSDFWHCPGDEGVLCQILAGHRIEAEHRLYEKLAGSLALPMSEQNTKLTTEKIAALS